MQPRLYALFFLSLALRAQATPPPPPECVPAAPAVSAQALLAAMTGPGDFHGRDCASRDLVARGASVTPALAALLRSGDQNTVHYALATLTGLGPQAAGAVPVMLAQAESLLRKEPGSRGLALFRAFGAIGAAAAPAIPLLIAKSGEPDTAYAAQMALGELGKYDAATVVPHLARQLQRVDLDTVASALGKIGPPARAALPALKAYLKRAIAAEGKGAEAAMAAIASIDEPRNSVPFLLGYLSHPTMANEAIGQLSLLGASATAAIPALVTKLNASRGAPATVDRIVDALREMAPVSVAAQEQLLIEATQYRHQMAAVALSEVSPLPARFVPALKKVADGKPESYFFNKALANAQAGK